MDDEQTLWQKMAALVGQRFGFAVPASLPQAGPEAAAVSTARGIEEPPAVKLLAGEGRSQTTHIVGTEQDARALQTLAHERGKPMPTIVISNGATAQQLLSTPGVAEKISTDQRVAISGSTPGAQGIEQAVRAARPHQRPESVTRWQPREGMGVSVDDYRQALVAQREQIAAAVAEAVQAKEAQQQASYQAQPAR